jgi:hypothetical protein
MKIFSTAGSVYGVKGERARFRKEGEGRGEEGDSGR